MMVNPGSKHGLICHLKYVYFVGERTLKPGTVLLLTGLRQWIFEEGDVFVLAEDWEIAAGLKLTELFCRRNDNWIFLLKL